MTASEQVFEEYKSYIIKELHENQYAPSFSTPESLTDWQNVIEYSDRIKSFLTTKSIMFIATLNDKNSNCTCPYFLKALTAMMANYLSKYVMHGDARMMSGEALSQKTINRIFAKTREELHDKLYNCKYIQMLFARQATKRAARKYGWKQGASAERQRTKQEAATRAYHIKRQVRSEFIAAQNMPGLKR